MKIHEYNEMMAYLTRRSYVSGGRVGFDIGGTAKVIEYLNTFPAGSEITNQ